MEQKADRLVVNVAKSLTSVNGSLLDVMKKVPGMIVVNGKLNMAGNSSVTILINGRSTQYLDMESLLREILRKKIKKAQNRHQSITQWLCAVYLKIAKYNLATLILKHFSGRPYIGQKVFIDE